VDKRNIVVRSPNWIGDFVLSVPAIRGLRECFPRAHLTVVAHSRVTDVASMVRGIDRVVEYDPGRVGRNPGGLGRFSRSISRTPIDVSIVFPLSFSSALMSFLSGARRRVGYSTELRGFLLTDRVRLPVDYRREHLSCSYARLVGELGVNGRVSDPDLEVPPVCRRVEQIMVECGAISEDRFIGIAPYAAYGPAKRWPMKSFLEVAESVAKRFGMKTLLFGSKEDAGLGFPAPSSHRWLLNMSGRLTVKEAAYLLRKCECLVSNDTGIAHVAAAVGTPVVSIFGSTSPEWTAPMGERNKVICEKEDCSPCFERNCRFGHFRCLRGVTVGKVLMSLEEILGE
jgi:heptosyltransferase-2